MKNRQILLINGAAARKLITMKEAIGAVERVFRKFGEGGTEMPSKIYLHLDRYNGDFRAMPAYVANLGRCGIKWVNVHPGNRGKGLPTVMATIILNDPSDGRPLAVIDATYLTAVRTGAAGGVAAKYLARKKSRTVALVGCGVQAFTQLAALAALFRIEKANIWGKRRVEAVRFGKEIRTMGSFGVTVADTVKACVKDSDIIVTTTPSRGPIIRSAWIDEGTHINAIGADAPGKQELDPEILRRAKIIVDARKQAAHSGEINVPLRKGVITIKDICADIGEVAAGLKRGRRTDKDITVFDSTGLAVQDIAVADLIYRKAVKRGLGRYVKW